MFITVIMSTPKVNKLHSTFWFSDSRLKCEQATNCTEVTAPGHFITPAVLLHSPVYPVSCHSQSWLLTLYWKAAMLQREEEEPSQLTMFQRERFLMTPTSSAMGWEETLREWKSSSGAVSFKVLRVFFLPPGRKSSTRFKKQSHDFSNPTACLRFHVEGQRGHKSPRLQFLMFTTLTSSHCFQILNNSQKKTHLQNTVTNKKKNSTAKHKGCGYGPAPDWTSRLFGNRDLYWQWNF